MLLDIADEPVAPQRIDIGRQAIALRVGRARIDPERIVGELPRNEATRFRLVEADHHVDLPPRQRG